MLDIPDLEIGIHRWDASSYSVELRRSHPGDETEIHVSGRMAFDASQLLTQSLDNVAYGCSLGSYLFHDPALYREFIQAKHDAQTNDMPLRVRLLIGASAPELHSLRWELLRDPGDDSPLFMGDRIYFSRYLSSGDWQRVSLRPQADMRALALIANPADLAHYGLTPLDVAAEQTRLIAGLAPIPVTVLATGGSTPRATLDILSEQLREGYDILYLVCHGTMQQGVSYLWFEDKDGQATQVATDKIAQSLQELQQRPRLVVITACRNGDIPLDSQADPTLVALGPRLARIGIPAVVAMQGNIAIDTVARFMPVFFRELQRDGQIDRAMALARSAIRDQADEWQPLLFMRLRGGKIWYTGGFVGSATGPGDRKWASLITSLTDEKCTPILGPDIAESVFGTRRELAWRL